MTVLEFWQEFLQAKNLPKETKYFESFHFCMTKDLADSLLKLVLEGKKRATTGSVRGYEKDGLPLPEVCSYSIITNFEGEPFCVIQTTAVNLYPFDQVTFDIAKREGEDECLETWREGHERFFRMEAEQVGYEFDPQMLVFFEDFEVVYKRK